LVAALGTICRVTNQQDGVKDAECTIGLSAAT
jgi:hypothetical protein